LEYRKISLNASLVREVEDLIKQTRKYRSIAEFVNEAIRLRLSEVRRAS